MQAGAIVTFLIRRRVTGGLIYDLIAFTGEVVSRSGRKRRGGLAIVDRLSERSRAFVSDQVGRIGQVCIIF